MLVKVFIGLVAVMAILAGVIVMQPAEYSVVRTATINAPPPVVYGLINDFHQWEQWSPWAKLDPNMKTTYSGPPAGPGASYHWIGNDDVGEGRMTIKDSTPNDRVSIDLEFIKPFESRSVTTFTLKPEGAAGTAVSWTMAGQNNFMSKAMTLFMSMDKMVGNDFEKGLAQMKAVAEAKK
jgi:uncharacterized protein YndB with AHSA1/START domain